MQKLIFAAAMAVAATPLQAAQTADPDVNKLPAGPEKAVVAEVCTACHELGRIVNGSYDAKRLAQRRQHDGQRRRGADSGPDRAGHELPDQELPGKARTIRSRKCRAR